MCNSFTAVNAFALVQLLFVYYSLFGGCAESWWDRPVDGSKYLVLGSADVPSLAHWSRILLELLALSASTGRVLVEPCVRAGHIVPCRAGRVYGVPAWSTDPGPGNAYPVSKKCNLHFARIEPDRDESYPLSAYLDSRG
jgi:hypothetical protein